MYTKVSVKSTLTKGAPPSQKSSLPTDVYAPDVYMTPSTVCSAIPHYILLFHVKRGYILTACSTLGLFWFVGGGCVDYVSTVG